MNNLYKALITLMISFGLMAPALAADHGMKKNIVETAIAADDFNSLVAAVQAAGLVDKLQEKGPFTVFAPNDAAFAKIPADTLNALLADPETLGGILGLHVIAGKKMATDVLSIDQATTITGKILNFDVKDGMVYVNGSMVIATDIETSNGVIHVIDTVITK